MEGYRLQVKTMEALITIANIRYWGDGDAVDTFEVNEQEYFGGIWRVSINRCNDGSEL